MDINKHTQGIPLNLTFVGMYTRNPEKMVSLM